MLAQVTKTQPGKAMAMKVSAAMLAGGKSSRMGVDKALVTLEDGGPTLGDLVLASLHAVADDVMVVAPSRPGYERFDARLVEDLHPGAGGLGGIASALHAARYDVCLVVGCDTPFLAPSLLRCLVEWAREGLDVVVPRLPGESRQGGRLVWQTLTAVYARRCLVPIERQLAAGEGRIIAFYPEVAVMPVDDELVRRFDPGLRSFVGLNTPEALARARAERR
jgi:molybdopterin-guanine dinucleotide biosynthesis protein A